MIKYTSALFSITVMSLLLIACNKRKDDLSRPTNEGKDILWCKVDGVEHIYRGKPTSKNYGVIAKTKVKQLNNVYGISIDARNVEYDDNFSIFVDMTNEINHLPELNKRYPMTTNVLFPFGSHYYTGSSNDRYEADTNRSWVIFSRHNDQIISGTFEFYGSNNTSVISITQGYFDVIK